MLTALQGQQGGLKRKNPRVLLSPCSLLEQIRLWGMRVRETLFLIVLADIHFLRTGPVV